MICTDCGCFIEPMEDFSVISVELEVIWCKKCYDKPENYELINK